MVQKGVIKKETKADRVEMFKGDMIVESTEKKLGNNVRLWKSYEVF